MKKSIFKLATKVVRNTKTVKGGNYGSGTRGTSSTTNNKAELL